MEGGLGRLSPVEALREPWSRGGLGDGKVGRRVIAAPLNTGHCHSTRGKLKDRTQRESRTWPLMTAA